MSIPAYTQGKKPSKSLVVRVVWNHLETKKGRLDICEKCVRNIHKYCLEKGLTPPGNERVFYVPYEWELTHCIHTKSVSFKQKIVVPYDPNKHDMTRV